MQSPIRSPGITKPARKRFEEFAVSVDGSVVPVTMVVPESGSRSHVLFACYGGSPSFTRQKLGLLTDPAVELGYTAVLFDYRGMVPEKPPPFRRTGLATRVEDAREVLSAVKRRLSRHQYSLLGISMGGYVATHLVRENVFRGVALIAPAAYHGHAVTERIPFTDAFTAFLNDTHRYPFSRSDAFRHIAEHRGEFLLVEFGDDHVIPNGIGDAYFHAAGGRSKRRVVLPKYRHNGTFDETEVGAKKRKAISAVLLPWLMGL